MDCSVKLWYSNTKSLSYCTPECRKIWTGCVGLFATTVAMLILVSHQLFQMVYCTGIFIQMNKGDNLQYFCDKCIREECSVKFGKINPSSVMPYMRTIYRRVEHFWITSSCWTTVKYKNLYFSWLRYGLH